MSCMLAVSGSAGSHSTSEQCVEEHNPQPYRAGFEQVIASLGAARPIQEARSIYKGPLALEGEPIDEMEVVHLPPGVYKVLLVHWRKCKWRGHLEAQSRWTKTKDTYVQIAEHP
jgi:hypothetical protein